MTHRHRFLIRWIVRGLFHGMNRRRWHYRRMDHRNRTRNLVFPGTVARGSIKDKSIVMNIIADSNLDIGLTRHQMKHRSLLCRAAQNYYHLVHLVGKVADQHTVLRHAVHDIAVNENGKHLVVLRLKTNCIVFRSLMMTSGLSYRRSSHYTH